MNIDKIDNIDDNYKYITDRLISNNASLIEF